ncbi:probable maltase [Cimex lectularius]|uniref:alpha-glucosidase n=1 Tax=Cimex lectularius TaxID=79782 RepID=A0A8I6S9G1_CIMLE|nr:probable maltase [Cimex lectularius]
MDLKCRVVIFTAGLIALMSGVHAKDPHWWKNSVIYQVYPKSFQSTTGNGTGDLKGVIARLPYLKDLGVDAVWLNSFYPSESKADGGYDVSDYEGVDPDFGTMNDFKLLVEKCHNLSMRIILDFVPNHSSVEHEWFKKSVKREEPYTNFYVWRDPGPTGLFSNEAMPPNNWMSVINGSAWTYNKERNQFYLHQFLPQQPDLNYSNPEVMGKMEDVLRFWLQRGVDGFVVDSAFALWEDQAFRDEPPIAPGVPVTDYSSLKHVYTADQDKNFDILADFRRILDEYYKKDGVERLMITESYTKDALTLKKYYGTKDKQVAHFPFNFFPLMTMKADHVGVHWKNMVETWFYLFPLVEYWPNWVMGNHDHNRLSSRFSPEHTDIINIALMSTPGTFVNYYGDELALEDSFVRRDEAQDLQGLLAQPDQFYRKTRDPERGPMPWNKTENGGFSCGKPWIPMTTLTDVQEQQEAVKSHLKLFKSLVKMRKLNTFSKGEFAIDVYNATTVEVLIITRSFIDHPTVLTVVNFGRYPVSVDLRKYRPTLPNKLYVYASSANSPSYPREILPVDPLLLVPVSGIVLSTSTLD